MSGKKACIVADLRTGEHLAKIPDIVAVFSAAGGKTDVTLKEYGGETLKLAQKAARDGYDLVMGYGGGGKPKCFFNGVLKGGGKKFVGGFPAATDKKMAVRIAVPPDTAKT